MRQSKMCLVVLSVLLMGLLVGCGGGGDDSWTTYQSDSWSVTFDMPAKWVAKDADDGVYVADSQANLESNTFIDGAGVIITTSPLADLGGFDSPVTLVEFFSEFVASGGSGMSVEKGVAQLTIQGKSAATITLKGAMDGQEGYYTITVIMSDETVVLSIAVDTTEDNAFNDTLTRIVKSIKF